MTNSDHRNRFDSLRDKARELLTSTVPPPLGLPQDVDVLVEEMHVLHTELEVQAEELRLAQHDAEAARQHYFALFDDAPVAFVLLDEDEQIVELNQRGTELLGLTRRPLRKPAFSTYVARQDLDLWPRSVQLLGQGQRTFEMRMRQVGGGTFVAQCKLSRWKSRTGTPGYLVGLLDVTVLREAEAARRVVDEQYRALFESSRDGILILDAETNRIVDANPAAATLLGADKPQLFDRHRDDLMPEERVTLQSLQVTQQLRDTNGLPTEIVLRSGSGKEVPVEVALSQHEVGARKLVFYHLRDLGARRELEREKVRVAEAALRTQRLEALGQLAAGVAHDMNNMLAAIAGATTELLGAALPPALAEAAGDIESAIRRGQELTSALLTTSRRSLVRSSNFDFGLMIRDAARLLVRVLPKSIHVEVQVDDDPLLVFGDAGQWSHAILNLGVNARDAMASGGKLELRAHRIDDKLHLVVSDDGRGMPEEVCARAFEPFFTTKPTPEANGLGLSHVYGVAQAHGASVELTSKLGVGTTFRFVIPLVRDVALTTSSRPTEAPPVKGLALVVDDDASVRRSTARTLRVLGVESAQVADGASALQSLESHPLPTIILCDLAMPGLNGLEVARRVRTRWPELPFVAISGFADDATRLELAGLGIEVLAKPFTMAELSSAMDAAREERRLRS